MMHPKLHLTLTLLNTVLSMTQPNQQTSKTTLVILAGGEGTRINQTQKGLIIWQGKPFVKHLIDRFKDQVATTIISCHQNPQDYTQFDAQIVCDEQKEYLGPLAGIQASLAACQTPLALILACDCPLVPATLLNRLQQALIEQAADIALANDGKRLHQLPVLVKTKLGNTLQQQIASGRRSMRNWFQHHQVATADFSDEQNSFLNINSLEDLDLLSSITNKINP